MFEIIMAHDENYGIGKNNKLPWNCPEDLKYFKETTINHICIVGKNTWNSMPQDKILKNRTVIVVSRTSAYLNSHFVCNSFANALLKAYSLLDLEYKKIFVIGGALLYSEAFDHNDLEKLHVTKIKGVYDCDTYINILKLNNVINRLHATKNIQCKDFEICIYTK